MKPTISMTLNKLNWTHVSATVGVLVITVSLGALLIAKVASEHLVISKQVPPKITEITLKPEITMPKTVGLYDLDVSLSTDALIVKDEWKEKKRLDRQIGKVESIKFNAGGNNFIVTTTLGWVVAVPMSVPLRMGEELKVRQDYDEDSEKYASWICPNSGKLCTQLSSK